MPASRSRLSSWLDRYPASGRYSFTQGDLVADLGVSVRQVRESVARLLHQRRLASPRQGFYVIVPPEYRDAGAPPPDWYMDKLMAFQGRPYYVGLLTAAALLGAAHQQPQEFQVVTTATLRPIDIAGTTIRFFGKRNAAECPTTRVKSVTGYFRISTPEVTAVDLVRYARDAGSLSHVATILTELVSQLTGKRLVEAAARDGRLSTVQRLGFLLEHLHQGNLTKPLEAWLRVRPTQRVLLAPGVPARGVKTDSRWNIVVNDTIETDR